MKATRRACAFLGHTVLLARDTFLRTNRRAIAVMFVCLSVYLSVRLLLAVQSVVAPPTTRVTPSHAGRRHQSNLPSDTSLGRV